eukprot:m.60482 g.60482  ORF g.60482 m.60482 type:complete len:644 (+) comp12297_c0_seq1:40-1971(+)
MSTSGVSDLDDSGDFPEGIDAGTDGEQEYEESQRAGRTTSLSVDTDVEFAATKDAIKLRRVLRKHVGDLPSHHSREGTHGDSHLASIAEDSTPDITIPFLPGELLIFEFVRAHLYQAVDEAGKSAELGGYVCISNFRVLFVKAFKQMTHDESAEDLIRASLPLTCVASMEAELLSSWLGRKRCLLSARPNPAAIAAIEIVGKDFRLLRFRLHDAEPAVMKKLTDTLLHHVHPTNYLALFAFDHASAAGTAAPPSLDADLHDTRMCLVEAAEHCGAFRDQMMTCSDENIARDCCPTYGPFVVVPLAMGQNLKKMAPKYHGNRSPVWAFTFNFIWLFRCGPPLDPAEHPLEPLLRGMRPDYHTVTLPDLLPGLDEIAHAYEQLRPLCMPHLESTRTPPPRPSAWLSSLDSTKWPALVTSCLRVASQVARRIHDRQCVLLIGGEEADLDCIISSLVQLILDPEFRTGKGFNSLIRREWLMAGHPFATRLGHVTRTGGEPFNITPVFLLFLDCVHQLMRQYPLQFFYTEYYLIRLWDEALACQYGTFLFDCDATRTETSAALRLLSVFKHIDGLSDEQRAAAGYTNPFYARANRVMWPQHQMPAYRFWSRMFLRWRDPSVTKTDPIRAFELRLVSRYLAAARSAGRG